MSFTYRSPPRGDVISWITLYDRKRQLKRICLAYDDGCLIFLCTVITTVSSHGIQTRLPCTVPIAVTYALVQSDVPQKSQIVAIKTM